MKLKIPRIGQDLSKNICNLWITIHIVVIIFPNSNKILKPTQGKHNRGRATGAGNLYFNNRIQLWASSGAKRNKKTWLTREKMYSHKWKKILSSYSRYTACCYYCFVLYYTSASKKCPRRNFMRGLLQYDINVLNIISTVNAKGDSL